MWKDLQNDDDTILLFYKELKRRKANQAKDIEKTLWYDFYVKE